MPSSGIIQWKRRYQLLLSPIARVHSEFDDVAALGEEIHAPGIRGFDHRATIDRLQQLGAARIVVFEGHQRREPRGVAATLRVPGIILSSERSAPRRQTPDKDDLPWPPQ